MVNEELLKKIRSGKDLTEEEIESLPEGPLKTKVKKRQALNAQIRQEAAREGKRKRTADTRRKILAGAWVLDEAEQRKDFREFVLKQLDSFLTRPDDRALFDLPPRKEELKKAQEKPENGEPQE